MRARKTTTAVRQDQIARSALRIIADKGLRALSMSALAREVGIVPSGIYRHFKGKNDVVDAVLRFIHARLMANVRAVESGTENSLTQLHTLFIRHIALIKDNKAIPQVVFSEDVLHSRASRRRALRQSIQQYLAAVASLISRGQQQRCIRNDVPSAALALHFLGLIQPAAIIYSLSRGSFDISKHATTVWQLFAEEVRPRANGPGQKGDRQ